MHKSASDQCDGDTHLDIIMVAKHGLCSKAQGTSGGGTDEGIKQDRGGFQNG